MIKPKPLVWLHGAVKPPPFSTEARLEAGYLLRRLQQGEKVPPPHSKPMTVICASCHELIIDDKNKTWRLLYRVDDDAIIILEVFEKKTQKTPKSVMDTCKKRLISYDSC